MIVLQECCATHDPYIILIPALTQLKGSDGCPAVDGPMHIRQWMAYGWLWASLDRMRLPDTTISTTLLLSVDRMRLPELAVAFWLQRREAEAQGVRLQMPRVPLSHSSLMDPSPLPRRF